MENSNDTVQLLAQDIEMKLLKVHGSPVLSGQALHKALGYKTSGAFRQALFHNRLPIKVFEIQNRRGKFALVSEIAIWLAEQRYIQQEEDNI